MIPHTIAATAILIGLSTAPTIGQDGVELGILECVIEGGSGFIFGSSKDLSCVFTPADAALASDAYFGVVNKFGLDIGSTNETVMQWAVVAPAIDVYRAGALAGDYVGASAEASAGVGGGANFLVGGFERSFSLQPISVQTQTGLNLAVGVAEFQLRSTSQ